MYEELLKVLRTCSKRDSCFWLGDTCPYMGNRLCDDKAGKAADAIEDLDNRLNLHRQGKIRHWIPVTEQLPEMGRKVLVCAYGYDILTARMKKQTVNGYPVFECNGIFLEVATPGRITHWMPLPEPPKADKDGEA